METEGLDLKKPFMTYYEHLSKLSKIANKQTMFLMHLLHSMEFNAKSKQHIVDLTARRKREIIEDIGGKSKAPLRLAENYIGLLVREKLIKRLGDGAYAIYPEAYSYGKYVPKELRSQALEIYETRVFRADGSISVEAHVIDVNGDKIDLT